MSLDQVPINRNYQDYTLKTRVICFFYDAGEYEDEINDLEAAARKLSYRNNLRVAMVTEPKVIKYIKRNGQTAHLFPDLGFTTCSLLRYDGHVEIIDISSNTNKVNFYSWINEHQKKKVDELNSETLTITTQMRKSLFLAFVDFDSKDPDVVYKSQQAIFTLQQV